VIEMDLHEVSIILENMDKEIKRLEDRCRKLEDDLRNHERSQYAHQV
jgi:hypothetical protein